MVNEGVMKKIYFSCLALGFIFNVYANSDLIPPPPTALQADSIECKQNGGTLFAATVVSNPKYSSGKLQRGVELSHTHINVVPLGEKQSANNIYDVAIDNVYAMDYDVSQPYKRVPESLTNLKIGTNVELCGQPYSQGGGIHWVHSNCGQKKTAAKPDGSIKIINADGTLSNSLTDNQEYCTIF